MNSTIWMSNVYAREYYVKNITTEKSTWIDYNWTNQIWSFYACVMCKYTTLKFTFVCQLLLFAKNRTECCWSCKIKTVPVHCSRCFSCFWARKIFHLNNGHLQCCVFAHYTCVERSNLVSSIVVDSCWFFSSYIFR
jgi:hypothetical protein